MTPSEIWAVVAWVAAAIVLLSNAAKAIASAWQAAKAPNVKQDERLSELEEWRKEVDRKLNNDKQQLEEIQQGLQASYQAQLALLDHALDGNNIKQMQDAKTALHQHLIKR
jgi:plasmid rolling circle replication initiator protein Rep